ncbi:hypothetical protein ACOSP7_004514 [Xanthoceras sorbifolium]
MKVHFGKRASRLRSRDPHEAVITFWQRTSRPRVTNEFRDPGSRMSIASSHLMLYFQPSIKRKRREMKWDSAIRIIARPEARVFTPTLILHLF